jgi:hypothetical protein
MRFDPNNGELLPDLSRGTTDDGLIFASGITSVSVSVMVPDDLIVPPGPIGSDDLIVPAEPIDPKGPIGSDDLIGPAGPIILPTGPIDFVTPIGPAEPIWPVREWRDFVRYQLRQDVRFHDGSALTAEDVVFSYNRAMESSTWSELLNGIRIISIETPDSYTVVFTLSGTGSIKRASLNPQIWTLPIVPARLYQSDPKRFITNPVGCGPFIAELNQSGKPPIVQLKAFEQYYLGRPRLQNLSIALLPDDLLIQRLVAGQLNAIVLPEHVELGKSLKLPADKYQTISTTRGKTRVVHVQERALRERLPNNYETNWNAHLWYI